jgi:microsomal dipeptidase-like Zn-dependent dipeptidase
MIQALAANGGVIQICFLSSYLRTPQPNPEMDKAFQELLRRGYSEKDIEKIWGGNVMRVLQKVIDISKAA